VLKRLEDLGVDHRVLDVEQAAKNIAKVLTV